MKSLACSVVVLSGAILASTGSVSALWVSAQSRGNYGWSDAVTWIGIGVVVIGLGLLSSTLRSSKD